MPASPISATPTDAFYGQLDLLDPKKADLVRVSSSDWKSPPMNRFLVLSAQSLILLDEKRVDQRFVPEKVALSVSSTAVYIQGNAIACVDGS